MQRPQSIHDQHSRRWPLLTPHFIELSIHTIQSAEDFWQLRMPEPDTYPPSFVPITRSHLHRNCSLRIRSTHPHPDQRLDRTKPFTLNSRQGGPDGLNSFWVIVSILLRRPQRGKKSCKIGNLVFFWWNRSSSAEETYKGLVMDI